MAVGLDLDSEGSRWTGVERFVKYWESKINRTLMLRRDKDWGWKKKKDVENTLKLGTCTTECVLWGGDGVPLFVLKNTWSWSGLGQFWIQIWTCWVWDVCETCNWYSVWYLHGAQRRSLCGRTYTESSQNIDVKVTNRLIWERVSGKERIAWRVTISSFCLLSSPPHHYASSLRTWILSLYPLGIV